MDEQVCLYPGSQMIFPGCALSQDFAVLCGWPQALTMGTGLLRVIWILGEAWPQAVLSLYHPSLAIPKKKEKT